MDETVEIQSGTLAFTVNHHFSSKHYSFFDLLAFGARQNPKRGYLFISKVLGKHIPCQPATMRESYQQLANQIEAGAGPCLVVGLAETATGLGAGVAEALAMPERDVLYTHTTRYHLTNTPVIFSIDESHSHAPAHIIYQPMQQQQLKQAQTAVLVDDEITTGNTLLQLSENLIEYTSKLKKIVWVSLVSWLSEQRKSEIRQLLEGVEVDFVCFVSGDFHFTPNNQFVCELPANAQKSISHQRVSTEIRTGISFAGISIKERLFKESSYPFYTVEGNPFTIHGLSIDQKYTVLGYGEFLYQPYKLAELMEHHGFDVLFQSTTRSPIMEGDGITRKEAFMVENCYENYVYNRPEERTTIVVYETYEQYRCCGLARQIDCIPIIKEHFEV